MKTLLGSKRSSSFNSSYNCFPLVGRGLLWAMSLFIHDNDAAVVFRLTYYVIYLLT